MQAAGRAVVRWKALAAGMAWVLGRMLGWQPGAAIASLVFLWGGHQRLGQPAPAPSWS